MRKDISILIAEDDEGHAALIKKNLQRSGIENNILHFKDGREILDFFFKKENNEKIDYVLLLDIRMPKVDGIEVLKKLKEDSFFKKIPVIIITTTDDPQEVEKCYNLGCMSYLVKSINYGKFVESIRQLGLYLKETDYADLLEGS